MADRLLPLVPGASQDSSIRTDFIFLDHRRRKFLNQEILSTTSKAVRECIAPETGAYIKTKRQTDLDCAIDEFNNRLLHLAVANQDEGLVTALLLKGANPNVMNNAGISPLRVAKTLNLKSVCQKLRRHGARDDNMMDCDPVPNRQADDLPPASTDLTLERKFPPVQYERECIGNAASMNTPQIAVSLRLHDGWLDFSDTHGATPLMKACFRGQDKIVNDLLNYGADAYALDSYGYSALMWACIRGSYHCLKLMIQHFKNHNTLIDCLQEQGIDKYFMTPLIAATYSGSVNCVKELLEQGCTPNHAISTVTPLMIATWMGRQDIVSLLLQYEATIPGNVEQWLVKGLLISELGYADDPAKLKIDHFMRLPQILPDDSDVLAVANDFINFLKNSTMETNRVRQTLVSEKTYEQLKRLWGAKIQASLLSTSQYHHDSSREHQSKVLKALRVNIPDHESKMGDTVSQILEYFQQTGTFLNTLHLVTSRKALDLIVAILESKPKDLLANLSAQVSHVSTELLRVLDTEFGMSQPTPPANLGFFIDTALFKKILDESKRLRDIDMKELLVATKLAIGASPPSNWAQKLTDSALKLLKTSFRLVHLGNCIGSWPVGSINFSQFAAESMAVAQKPRRYTGGGMSFAEYQREQESKILEKMTNNNVVSTFPEAVANNTRESDVNEDPDKAFFESLDSHVHFLVAFTQKLKVARDAGQKHEFSGFAGAIRARLDGIMDEIRSYYVFEKLPDAFLVDKEPVKKQIDKLAISLIGKGDELLVRAKLASGVWPPPNADADMMKATMPCLASVKEAIQFAKKVVELARETKSLNWNPLDEHKRRCKQTPLVGTVFKDFAALENVLLNRMGKISIVDNEQSVEGLQVEVKDGREILKGGKLNKLIERLTDHNKMPDDNDRLVFLLTYSSFSTSEEILDQLMKRYQTTPAFGLDAKSHDLEIRTKIAPIRHNVTQILNLWIANYPEDFVKNRTLSEKCLRFFEEQVINDFGPMLEPIAASLRQIMTNGWRPVEEAVDRSQCPKPILLPNESLEKLYSELFSEEFHFLNIDPMEMARQITIQSFDIFKAIRPTECINQSWEKTDKLTTSLNICKFTKITNGITNWVATRILEAAEVKDRVIIIKYFSQLAQCCYQLNNLSSVTAITAGLGIGPVNRLEKTWAQFRDKFRKISDSLNELNEIVSPKGQYAKYRQTLKSLPDDRPILPFLGVFLTDLTFVDLGNPTYIPSNHYINFDKCTKISEIISSLQRYQKKQYALEPVWAIQDFLVALSEHRWPEEKNLYEASWECEPLKKEDDDDEEI